MGCIFFFATVALSLLAVALLAIICVTRYPPDKVPLDLNSFCAGLSRETPIPDPHVLIDGEWVPYRSPEQKRINFLRTRLHR